MPKFNIIEAIGLTLQTLPFILLRAGLFLVFGVFVLLYFGFAVLLGNVFGEGLAGLIFIIATIGIFPILKLFKHIALYFLQAGHIAVIAQIIREGKLPDGVSQIEFGKNLVVTKFKEVSVLLVVNEIVNAIVRSFNRTVVNMTSLGNLSALKGLGKLIKLVLHFSLTLVDESILSYILIHKDENYWNGAKDGLILYVQSWKPILINSTIMGLINAVSFIVFFFFFMIPMSFIFGHQSGFALGVSLVLAYLFKEALIYPLAMVSTILTFHHESEGKVPDPQWEARIDSVSDKFRELKQKAAEFVRGGTPRP